MSAGVTITNTARGSWPVHLQMHLQVRNEVVILTVSEAREIALRLFHAASLAEAGVAGSDVTVHLPDGGPRR